ncbi:MAG: tyrosine-type recombinase/integrase [Polyangia bacterium]
MGRSPARVLGPYYDANVNAYRLVVIEGERRKSVRLATEHDALSLKAELQKTLADQSSLTVGEALAEFIEYKRQQGLKPKSMRAIEYKLRNFLPLDEALCSLSAERAETLYQAERERLSIYGRRVANDTHKTVLKLAKLFCRWAIERGHLRANPFIKVKPVGKSNAGKPQLRIDEARRLFHTLLAEAQNGTEGATAVLCQLLLGLRSSELLERQVRDLDDSGRILWIPGGKTHNARRRLDVPEALRPLLLDRVRDKSPEAPIFGQSRAHLSMWLLRQLRRYCDRAGVPRVCPHSLRGLHSSLAVAAGSTPSVVASALGHGSFAITARHYVDPDTLRNSSVQRLAGTLSAETPAPAPDPLERLRALPPEQLAALLKLLDGAKPQ